jgi:ADP-glucose pyrophosphorylase
MPGVRVSRGARLRGAIVEEGVAVPPGFEAGFDVELDRARFTVQRTGLSSSAEIRHANDGQ